MPTWPFCTQVTIGSRNIMIQGHAPAVAGNSCVTTDYIMLEEIVSCERGEITPGTSVLSSSPSRRLDADKTHLHQEGENVVFNCQVREEINPPGEESISTEPAAMSSSSPLVATNNRIDIIASHRAAADLAATELEYRNYRNDITLPYLRCHNFFLLCGIMYVSFVVIALRSICFRVESEKEDCDRMIIGLALLIAT